MDDFTRARDEAANVYASNGKYFSKDCRGESFAFRSGADWAREQLQPRIEELEAYVEVDAHALNSERERAAGLVKRAAGLVEALELIADDGPLEPAKIALRALVAYRKVES